MYCYRVFTDKDGQRYRVPDDTLPGAMKPGRYGACPKDRVAFNQRRLELWIAWQKLGLRLPDPDFGSVRAIAPAN